MIREKVSPFTPHPWHMKAFLSKLTAALACESEWNGHFILRQPLPIAGTVAPM